MLDQILLGAIAIVSLGAIMWSLEKIIKDVIKYKEKKND